MKLVQIIMSLLILAVGIISFGCNQRKKIQSISQLSDKEFAVPTGTIADELVLSKFPKATFKYYNSVLDACIAVQKNNADAAAYDEPILRNIAAKNPGLVVLPDMITVDSYGFAVKPDNQKLKATIDSVLYNLRADGRYDEMMKRWLPEKGSPGNMPFFMGNSENGKLRFGTSAVTEPFSFIDHSGQITGFDIEIANHIAMALGVELEIVDMDFGAMIPALISGKVDLIGACITISEERAKKVLFSEPYYTGGIAALVKE